MSDAENEFLEDMRQLSISARLALAMCFLNEFCRRHNIEGALLDEYQDYQWSCPVIPFQNGDFEKWYSRMPALASAPEDADLLTLANYKALSSTNRSRFLKIISLSNDLLQMSFWGAGENDGTFEALKQIKETARPNSLPATTLFKFSNFEAGDGWGSELSERDIELWNWYSKNWADI